MMMVSPAASVMWRRSSVVVMVLHVRGRSPVSPVRWSSVIITMLHPVLLLSLGVVILLRKRERGHELTMKY